MNFRQVRKKIKTIQNVKKITNAMQMVSAVKMKKAQREALEGRAYRLMLDTILQRVIGQTSGITELNIPWVKQPDMATANRKLYVLISSNKGLCGAFNSYLLKHAFGIVDFDRADFIVVGNKGAEFVSRMGGKVIADFSSEVPFIDSVSAIFSLIAEVYQAQKYHEVLVIYNKFISSLRFESTHELLLPVKKIESLEEADTKDLKLESKKDKEMHADYIIEPSVEELLGPVIEDYLKEKLRSAIADSEAAEHSARMIAMKNATDNAGEIVYSLTLLRNKLRQAQITNELLDMVAAKESSEIRN